MQVVLVMFRNDGERRSFSVVRNMTVIGRREDCDLRIPVGEVSRKHCRLVLTDDGIRIEDLGSSNGTWVNAQRVQESDLNPGDTVTVGPVQFIVQIDGVPADNELVPPAPAATPRFDDDDSLAGFNASPTPLDAGRGEFTIDEAPGAPAEAPTEEFGNDSGEGFKIEDEIPAAELPAADEIALEDDLPGEPAGVEEFDLADESTAKTQAPTQISSVGDVENDPALPEFAASTAPSSLDDEFEMPDLEAAPESAPPSATNDPNDSEWDFEIEETSPEQSATDFKIDLDSPHRPHK